MVKKDSSNDKLSEKSSKGDLFAALEEAQAKLKKLDKSDRQSEKIKQDKGILIKNVSNNSVEDIVKKSAITKLETMRAFDHLEEKLTSEFQKLKDLEEAIDEQTKTLDEIYQIKIEADILDALILAQKESKEKFDIDMEKLEIEFQNQMSQKKEAWTKEQKDYLQSLKEQKDQLLKDRKREEEEYSYAIAQAKKKESDSFNERKAQQEKELVEIRAAVEKELNTREEVLVSKEAFVNDLKTQVDNFTTKLDSEVKRAVAIERNSLIRDHKHEMDLMNMRYDSDKKLSEHTISTLQEKVEAQEALIRQLTEASTLATSQVKQIAEKAIEGASKPKEVVYREETFSKTK